MLKVVVLPDKVRHTEEIDDDSHEEKSHGELLLVVGESLDYGGKAGLAWHYVQEVEQEEDVVDEQPAYCEQYLEEHPDKFLVLRNGHQSMPNPLEVDLHAVEVRDLANAR